MASLVYCVVVHDGVLNRLRHVVHSTYMYAPVYKHLHIHVHVHNKFPLESAMHCISMNLHSKITSTQRGDSAVIKATLEYRSDIVQELVDGGADLDLQNEVHVDHSDPGVSFTYRHSISLLLIIRRGLQHF